MFKKVWAQKYKTLLHCVGNAFSGNDSVVSWACHNSQVFKYNRFLPTPQYKILDERGYACLHSHSQICQQKILPLIDLSL